MIRYNIFGSVSSLDYDVLVYVDQLGSIDDNHKVVKEYNDLLEEIFEGRGMPKKKVNANLGILSYGRVVNVFKGTLDEVNNSVYNTYQNHDQHHPRYVEGLYDRKGFYSELKLKRCLRFILSFYSRIPELRLEIRAAMKGTFDLRIACLKKLDFTINTEFPNKKERIEDIYKVLAFQLAQTILLVEYGHEIYSKEEVIVFYKDLAPFINRKTITKKDLEYLEFLRKELVNLSEIKIKEMSNLKEEIL